MSVHQGDRVAILRLGIIGTVTTVDEVCANGAPCPCCGYGVGVMPDGDPDVRFGVAPAECLLVVGAAMVVRGGSA